MSFEKRVNDLLEENSILRTYIAEIELEREHWTEESLRALNEKLDRYILRLRGVPPEELAVEKQRILASQETVEELRNHVHMLAETVSQLKALRFEYLTKEQLRKLLVVRDTSLQAENKILKTQLREALLRISQLEAEESKYKVLQSRVGLSSTNFLFPDQTDATGNLVSDSELRTETESLTLKTIQSSAGSSLDGAVH
ncbi:hypothetical protein GL50803_0010256 [Giardia duodenalis]|uniref:Uncharacterized protein n=1 Tax=Giardia intestinalis (strain ATCC 50803 / WB clone C6) TaxID=184922 RepID=A8B6X0_GIAIC|nr:hypothetical protein GL50803_0010256 [Giardia intestinalis]KAE8301835.1 hypothetical protein GL50803_0010256 [Giardia intestinalis]|eukprot:XP_001709077.1 Hypothetical protein GL50803_10256 [Giardia lamblia ATCC 50803]